MKKVIDWKKCDINIPNAKNVREAQKCKQTISTRARKIRTSDVRAKKFVNIIDVRKKTRNEKSRDIPPLSFARFFATTFARDRREIEMNSRQVLRKWSADDFPRIGESGSLSTARDKKRSSIDSPDLMAATSVTAPRRTASVVARTSVILAVHRTADEIPIESSTLPEARSPPEEESTTRRGRTAIARRLSFPLSAPFSALCLFLSRSPFFSHRSSCLSEVEDVVKSHQAHAHTFSARDYVLRSGRGTSSRSSLPGSPQRGSASDRYGYGDIN